MKDRLINDLNEKQYQAATAGNGPILVVAGAGSGKTRTLAYRVAYLVSKGVAPDRILLLTFTRRAAKEMLDRAAQVLENKSTVLTQVWGGTFHATANRLLRIYSKAIGLSPDFTIMDQGDAQDLLDVIRHKKIGKQKKRFPRKSTLLSIYSRRMNSGENLDSIIKNLFPWCASWKNELKEIFKEYVVQKQKQNILDYDDLLFYWYNILEDKTVSESIESRFDHILVDEYQDTNKLQADILLNMRKTNKNIMVVGDDAQSIYSFRAATVKNILDFPKLYPDTKIIILEQNYRSKEPILKTTNNLIEQAKERYSKELFSVRDGDDLPKLITCKDENDESDKVIELVLKHYEEGVKLSDQAVLFRAGSHSAALEIALMKKEIPFRKYGGLKFLEAAHVKDFLGIIRILVNRKDEMAWFRIMQLIEGVGPATASLVFSHLQNNNFNLDSFQSAQVSKLIRLELLRLRKLFIGMEKSSITTLSNLLSMVQSFYKPLLENNYENSQPRLHDIEHLVELGKAYKTLSQFLTDLVLDPPSSTSDFAGMSKKDDDFLVLSTIHSAKGCEYDSVYLIHAADGCIPSDMSTGSEKEIEEELRLAYVAMTRARNYLYITWPLRFYSRPQGFSDRHVYSQCSRFFTPEVLKTMDNVTFNKLDQETDPGFDSTKTPMEIDIKSKIKSFWD
jgi:DNA helicase-2/ATP-dependent DNA helicase PcrA